MYICIYPIIIVYLLCSKIPSAFGGFWVVAFSKGYLEHFLTQPFWKGWPLAKREPKTKRGTNNYNMYPPSHKHWWNNKLLMFTFFYGEAFCGGPGTFDCRKLPWISFLRKLWFSSGRLIGSSFILKPSPSLCVTSYFVALKNIHSRSFNSSPAHKVSIPKGSTIYSSNHQFFMGEINIRGVSSAL